MPTETQQMTSVKRLSDYEDLVDPDILEEIAQLAERLKGVKVTHINSTRLGGGVAELLASLVPLFNDIGLETSWQTIEGRPEFFQVTKAFHNALQLGLPAFLSQEMFELYLKVNQENARRLDLGADVVFIHDQQPLTLVEHRSQDSHWIWRCHIDLSRSIPRVWLSRPEKSVWDQLCPYVEQYDEAIFSMAEFTQNLPIRQHVIPPAIDPLSEKSRPISQEEVERLYRELGIPRDHKVFLQVSRFDRFKDPIGVLQAYKLFREREPLGRTVKTCLLLAGGGASDDPEGAQVLEEVRARAEEISDVYAIERPPTSYREINALQSGADVVIQKSIREGFGLVVAEALWKKKPVVASPAGGIKLQILDGLTGFLVSSVEELSDRLEYLLEHPHVGERLGQTGHKHVRQHFLIPRELRDYLRVIADSLGVNSR